MVLAGERGRSGQRYLLSGENVTADQLMEQVASITGVRRAAFHGAGFSGERPRGRVELVSKMRGQPPPVTRDVLQILGRYAWYRHVEGAKRAWLDAAPAAGDADGHDSLAARPAAEVVAIDEGGAQKL